MRHHALAATLLALTSTGPLIASEKNAEAFSKTILEQIAAVQEPCGRSPEGAGEGTVVLCARGDSDFSKLPDAWEASAVMSGKATVIPRPVTGWVVQGKERMRWYAVGDKWVVVTLDPSNHKAIIAYPKDREGVLALEKGVVPPKRIPPDRSQTAWHNKARAGLSPSAQGTVILSSVVRKDGAVGDIEVLGCLPRHRGLEQAAIRTLKDWRYEPAALQGNPVAVSMVATFTYGPGGSFRVSESTNYTASDQSQSARPSSGEGAP